MNPVTFHHHPQHLQIILGEINAYQGKYTNAARLLQVSRAIDMYCNLRQFDRAPEIIPENDIESAKYDNRIITLVIFVQLIICSQQQGH